MKVSQIGLISRKLKKLDEQFPVQDMLIQTGQLEQFSSGIYAYGHIPYLVKKNIDKIIEKILIKYDCSILSLPLLQPESIWKLSGRLEKYVEEDVMFRTLTDKCNYCLAPTAEEAITKYASSRLISHKKLPVIYFQIGEKFRNEIRTRGYLLRGKCFDMMDAYSFGKNQNDLEESYEKMKKAFLNIFETLGLKVLPVGADSGNIGGNKSEEFMCLSEIGEDTILYDKNTNKAFNKELLDRIDAKEYLKTMYGIDDIQNLETKRSVELGHIFQLGNKYSKSMNTYYVDEEGKTKEYEMGCYGIGISRTLAMIYEESIILDENNNFKGISLPVNIAPYVLYIIPKLDDEEKYLKGMNIYNELINNNIPVLYDDRLDISIGAKIKDSKITGIPYMVVLGKTLDDNYIEIENNKTGKKYNIKVEKILDLFKKIEHERYENQNLENLLTETDGYQFVKK